MKFLVFQHVSHEGAGMLLDVLRHTGDTVEIVEFWKPYKIPTERFDALFVMGGPMGVYENEDQYLSKKDELAYIRSNLENLPMLGFCLGAQLIAHALHAYVYPNLTDGRRVKEVGYLTVDLTDAGRRDPLFAGFSSPMMVLQLHGDAFELPESAVQLARSRACEYQAFRYGDRTYGTLFHNEYTPQMVEKQIEMDSAWMHKDFDIDEEQLRGDARRLEKQMRSQCEQLFNNFRTIVLSSLKERRYNEQ